MGAKLPSFRFTPPARPLSPSSMTCWKSLLTTTLVLLLILIFLLGLTGAGSWQEQQLPILWRVN